MIPFLGVFIPLDRWLQSKLTGGWGVFWKRAIFVPTFLLYWGVVAVLWDKIPLVTRQALLRMP